MKGKLPLQKFHYRPIRNFRPTESSPLLAEPCAGCYLQSRSRLQHTHCKNELPGCKAARGTGYTGSKTGIQVVSAPSLSPNTTLL